MILQFLILILILILIHHNDLDHSGAARPGEQGDRHLIETLLFLADSGHSVQVWDVQSSLLDLIEETWTLLTLYSRLLRRARAGAAADQPAHYATKAGAAREALQGSPHPHPHPPLGLPGVLTPL